MEGLGGILEVASQHSEGTSAGWPLLDQSTPQPEALQHTKSKDVSKDENVGSLRQNHGKTILAVIQTTAILSSVVTMLIRIFPLCLLHVPGPLCRTTWLFFVSEVKTHDIDGIMLHIFGEQAAPQFEPTDSQHKLPKICHGTTST